MIVPATVRVPSYKTMTNPSVWLRLHFLHIYCAVSAAAYASSLLLDEAQPSASDGGGGTSHCTIVQESREGGGSAFQTPGLISGGARQAAETHAVPALGQFDIISHLVNFVDDKQYLFFAPVSTGWRDAWLLSRSKVTAVVTAHTSPNQLSCSITCGVGHSPDICSAIARSRKAGPSKVGALEESPLGRKDVLLCCQGEQPRCPEVGAAERISLERGYVLVCGRRRASCCSPVSAIERLPMGREYLLTGCWGGNLDVLKWARSNAVLGTRLRALLLPLKDISPVCNGHVPTDAHGTR